MALPLAKIYIGAKIARAFRSIDGEELLSSIRSKCKKIETRARNLQGDVIFDIHRHTESIHEISKTTNGMVGEIDVQYKEIVGMSQTTQEQIGKIDDQYKDIDNRIFQLQRTVDQQLNDAIHSQNTMFQMLKEVVSGKLNHPIDKPVSLIPASVFLQATRAGGSDGSTPASRT